MPDGKRSENAYGTIGLVWEQCENVRSGFNYQLHRHILNKTRFISLRSHPKIPISVLGFSTSQNRIAPERT
ncbi:MAG: hypothetical protein ACYTXY_39530 [Nostoc sp.]